MNAYARFKLHMQRHPIPRPLNFDIVMTFGAHHIGHTLSQYYLDYRTLCQANLAMVTDFELDIVQAISDPYREAADLGVQIAFPDDGLPLCQAPLLTDEASLAGLRPVAPENGPRMTDRLQSIALLHDQVARTVPIMGWVEGALAEANVLRDKTTLLTDLYDRPQWVHELLEFCVQVEIDFARAQVEAGADIIGLGDAIASQISAAAYAEFALPYERRIFDAVHELGAVARLHICGNITHLLPLLSESGADIVDIDWMVDLEHAKRVLGPTICTCGNFDPVAVMLHGTPEQVYQATTKCLDQGGHRNISGAGCEIPDGTPHANLSAQTAALADWADKGLRG